METINIICIGCPLGCPLSVTVDGEQIAVTGNTCPRGVTYAQKEVTNPTRIVTSSVAVSGGVMARASVKTGGDIPKSKIFDCMEAIRQTRVTAPVRIGDIIISDCEDTGVDIVATRDVPVL